MKRTSMVRRDNVASVLSCKPRAGDVVAYKVDGEEMVSRLQAEPTGCAEDLCIKSPVGAALVTMEAGQVVDIQAPGGPVRVELLRRLARVRR